MLKNIFLDVKNIFETPMSVLRTEKITTDVEDPAACKNHKYSKSKFSGVHQLMCHMVLVIWIQLCSYYVQIMFTASYLHHLLSRRRISITEGF